MTGETPIPGKKGCFPFLFLFALAAGGAILFGLGFRQYQNARVSKSWPIVPGVVVVSELYEYDSDDTTVYDADVRYQYTVNDFSYTGDKVMFGGVGSSNPTSAIEIVNRYPVGQAVEVYYDPADPGTAVLEKGVHESVWLPIGIGAGVTLLSLVMALTLTSPKVRWNQG